MRKLVYNIGQKDNNCQVIEFLKRLGYSRRIIIKLKANPPCIHCNNKHIRMVDKLYCGDILVIILQEDNDISPNFSLKVPVIYEDNDIIVYNKPPFMAVHPANGHQNDTLANAYSAHIHSSDIGAFHAINRLDRDTSGLCVVAKNALATSITAKSIKKEYTAIVCGKPTEETGRIEAPIYRPASDRIDRCVHEKGQWAATNYQVEKTNDLYSLVRIRLESGRTHQIRVHFSHIGYPLAGDSMYGGDMSDINRQALCCTRVYFIHPITHKEVNLCINIPNDMQKLIYDE